MEDEKLQIRKAFDVLLDRMFNEESEYQSLFIDFPKWNEKDEKGYVKVRRYKITISKYDR